MADELNKLRAEHADEMALAVIEHLGPAALAGGTMSVLEAFERGFIAARRQTASGEPVAVPVKLADDELERSISRACPTCRGNDSDAPCAYPSKKMPGCLRDARLDAEKEAQGDVPPLPPHRGYTGPHKVYYESDLCTYAAAYAAATQPAAQSAVGADGAALSQKLWCDLQSDSERSNWLLLGRGYETGVVAKAIQNDLAMAYHRLSISAPASVPDDQIDAMLDRVLRASGSNLRHYSMQRTLDDMRAAMRDALAAAPAQQDRQEGGEHG